MQAQPFGSSDFPATPWELPAAESHVLLHGLDDNDPRPFKLAVMELVARRVLALTEVAERGAYNRPHTTSVLSSGAEPREPTERSLAAVWRLFRATPRHPFADGTIGLSFADFGVVARRRYGQVGRFATQEVLPTLIERGYYAREERRLLGIFRSGRYVVTPAGRAAQAELQRRVELGEQEFGGWARNDPNRALLYAGMAGSSLLLMPFLFHDLDGLQRRSGDEGSGELAMADGGGSAPLFDRGPGPIEALPPSPDVGQLGGLGGLDFGAFDTFEAGFGSFDTAFESPASDSGSWSGSDSSGGGSGWGGDGGGGGGGGGD